MTLIRCGVCLACTLGLAPQYCEFGSGRADRKKEKKQKKLRARRKTDKKRNRHQRR